jgi:opacity protein-like surface antigen
MRTLVVLFVAGFVLLAGGTPASAEGLYAGGQAGLSWGGGETDNSGFDLEFASGPFVDVFVGKDLGSVRVEGELAYRQNDMDNLGGIPVTGEMTSVAFMANIYYDFGEGTGITPYVGLGLGAANITVDSGIKDTDTAFAFQLMLGISFPVSETLSITGELRGFGAVPEFEDAFGVPFEQEYGVGSLALGLRYSF